MSTWVLARIILTQLAELGSIWAVAGIGRRQKELVVKNPVVKSGEPLPAVTVTVALDEAVPPEPVQVRL